MAVIEATWINGVRRYCEDPNRFQGKPPKIRATIISSVTQRAAQASDHTTRLAQGALPNRSASLTQSGSVAGSPVVNATGKNFQPSHVQAPKPRARKALKAVHPSTGAHFHTKGTGISSNQ